MTALLASVFTASLMGSLHCVGMCGGFVAIAAGGAAPGTRGAFWPLLTYQLGRLLAYAVLGMAAGALGSAVDLAGSTAGLADIAAILAGGTVLTIAVAALARALGARLPQGPRFAALGQFLAKVHLRWSRKPPIARALVLGLVTSLLPCGWLWAFVLTASGTADALWGGLVMAVFWAGTVPALVGLGFGVRALFAPLARRLPLLAPTMLLVLGVVLLVWRAQLVLPAHALQPANPATGAAPAIPTKASCCHEQND